MGDNHVLSPILSAYLDSDKQADPPVDFDTPAGRTRACDASHADRIVLALRYPADDAAEPLASVSKDIAGLRCWLVVFDHDVLAGLLRMGWRESEAGE